MTTWLRIDTRGTFNGARHTVNLWLSPCPTVNAGALGPGNRQQHYWIEDDMVILREARTKRDKQLFDAPDAKPPYRVPLMGEIAEIPWNGLTVVSTFAGAGGSSLGYRMAGFRVLWANEFVPAAQESYRANMREGTVLDGRDIRKVTAASILGALGLGVGELDVLDGSPPCQAFSTAGKREKGWGQEREYAHGATQKNEELFTDFVRLRDGLMPRSFVAENVSGLVKGAAKGFFLRILAELKRGYRVEARVLDAQWLGVPQQRQRVIFVGVRDDLGLDPAFPSPLPWRYSVRDALPWLGGAVRASQAHKGNEIMVVKTKNAAYSGKGARFDGYGGAARHQAHIVAADISGNAIGDEWDKLNPGQQSEKYFSLVKPAMGDPCPTITAAGGQNSGIACVVHPTQKRKFTILELKRICAWPDDAVLTGSYAQMWERLGNSVPPIMAMWIASAVRDKVLLPWQRENRKCLKRASSRGSGPTSKKAIQKNAGPGKVPSSRRRDNTATSACGEASGSTRTASPARSRTVRSAKD